MTKSVRLQAKSMKHVEKRVIEFLALVGQARLEVYNEFSFQHELGFYLRECCSDGARVNFERPISYFGFSSANFAKREIDICLVSPDRKPRIAIELKFPRQGPHPEQMFAACQDIAFLEQLVAAGFEAGLFLMLVDDELFYRGRDQAGIYRFFRRGLPIHGRIVRPTGQRDSWVEVRGSYPVRWSHLGGGISYWMSSVARSSGERAR